MNIIYAAGRIRRFFFNRRREILTKPFWVTVFRVVKNRFNYFQRVSKSQFLQNLSVLEKRPCYLHIELTNLCNANCIFCAYQYQSRPILFISDAVYTKALDDYCALGGGDLRLEVVVGDPAVDPNFIRRIEEARKRKEIVNIQTITNLIALKTEQISELLNSGITKIQISTGPLRQDLYERIYRNRSYKKVLRNITLLLQQNQALGCPVDIKLAFRSNLTMRETLLLDEYKEIAHFPHEVEFNTDFDTWTGEITSDQLLPGMHIRPLSRLDREPCIWLYESPIVFEDGKLGLCGCRDFNANSELIVGNIMESSLHEIWQSEKVRQIRYGFFHGDYPEICSKCSQYVNLDVIRTSVGTRLAALTDKRFKETLPDSSCPDAIVKNNQEL